MSKLMVTSFFPGHCSHVFEPYLPELFDFLYPQDVVESCPEQTVEVLETTTIRKPFLASFAIAGILVGLIGAFRIYNYQTSTTSRATTNLYWSISFFFFGTMNTSGLLLHCLVPPTTISPLEQPIWWIGDTYSTGAFGMSLWAAALMESLRDDNNSGIQTQKEMLEELIHWVWLAGNAVGIMSIVWFLVSPEDGTSTQQESTLMSIVRMIPATLPLEMWYGGATTTFGSTALIWMFLQTQRDRSYLVYAFVVTYILLLAGIGLDPFFCRQFNNQFLDLLTTSALFFLATDVLYAGLWIWLEQQNNNNNNKNNHILTTQNGEQSTKKKV